MRDGRAPDVLIVSLGATEGLRRADRALCDGLRHAGASAGVVAPPRPRALPTLMLTDLAWARAARAAGERAAAPAVERRRAARGARVGLRGCRRARARRPGRDRATRDTRRRGRARHRRDHLRGEPSQEGPRPRAGGLARAPA